MGVLQNRGHTYEVVSSDFVIEDEITDEPFRIKRLTKDIDDTSGFDGFAIISGNMQDTEANWHDPKILTIVESFNTLDKPIAAICCSVPAIRFAAEGKKVSFFPLIRSREILQRAGAILNEVTLTRDGNLVTGEHQMAAEMIGEELCNLLEGIDTEFHFYDSGFKPGGRKRRPIDLVEKLRRIKAENAARETAGARREDDADQSTEAD